MPLNGYNSPGLYTYPKIDEKGNILTITEFGPGNSIGGNLLFSENPLYPMTVIAKDEVILLILISIWYLNYATKINPFLLNILSISDKAAILTNKIKTISMKSIGNNY